MRGVAAHLGCLLALIASCSTLGAAQSKSKTEKALSADELARAIQKLKSDDNGEKTSALSSLRGTGEQALPAFELLRPLISDPDRFIAQDALYVLCGIGPQAATAVPAIVAMAVDQVDAWGEEAATVCGSELEGFGPASIPRWLREIPQEVEDLPRTEIAIQAMLSPGVRAIPQLVEALRTEQGRRLNAVGQAVARLGVSDTRLVEAVIATHRAKRFDADQLLYVIERLSPPTRSLVAQAREFCRDATASRRERADAALKRMEGPRSRGCTVIIEPHPRSD